MNVEVGGPGVPIHRRVFVASVLAAGAGSLASAQQHAHGAGDSDPVVDATIRELGRIHRDIRREGVRGEHARRAAGALRSLSAYGKVADLDARVRTAIRRRGRAAQDDPYNVERMAGELKPYGFEVFPSDFPALAPRDQRRAVVAQLESLGFAATIASTASVLEQIGERLDAAMRPGGIVLAQADTSDHCRRAYELQVLAMQAFMLMVCWDPVLFELCFLIGASILMLQVMMWWNC